MEHTEASPRGEGDKELHPTPEPTSARATDDPPPLVRRNLPFDQSKNVIQVKHNQATTKISSLLRHDFFHVLLRLPVWANTLFLLCLWTIIILVFAGAYVAVDRSDQHTICSIGLQGEPVNYYTAFAFSLETCTTVGYGLPNSVNAFFERCPGLQATVFIQMTLSMFFNAFLIAIIIARIANTARRAVQVVFSNKAIVSVVDGQVRFQFRVFDVDARHPVVEAHVRLYAVAKDRPVPRILRTVQPNDELGGMLFLSLPQLVSHQIDVYSLLHPSPSPDDDHPAYVFNNHKVNGLTLRQADSASCTREEVICYVCGDDYATHEHWVRHVQFQQRLERQFGFPEQGTHLGVQEKDMAADRLLPINDLPMLQDHFASSINEVICIVEGIDPLTSGTFSALYSYQMKDIVWDKDATFRPCLRIESNMYRVDLDRFQHIITKPSGRTRQRKQHSSFRLADTLYYEDDEPERSAVVDDPELKQ